jgi:pilus assembly protein Flp/PilA
MPMMRALWRTLCTLRTERKAATAVEYGLILALIFMAMLVGVTSVGTTTAGMWNYVANSVLSA